MSTSQYHLRRPEYQSRYIYDLYKKHKKIDVENRTIYTRLNNIFNGRNLAVSSHIVSPRVRQHAQSTTVAFPGNPDKRRTFEKIAHDNEILMNKINDVKSNLSLKKMEADW